MKKPNLLVLLFSVVFSVTLVAQPKTSDLQGSAGTCYAQCYIQDEYEITEERIMVKDVQVLTEVSPPEYTTIKRKVLIRKATVKKVPTPPVYETVSEQVLITPERKELRVIPAVYETYTEQIEIKPASKKIILKTNGVGKGANVSAVGTMLPYVIAPASFSIDRVPLKYDEKEETTLVRPATSKWIYKENAKSCLSMDPKDCMQMTLVEVPAEYQTVLVKTPKSCPDGYLPSSVGSGLDAPKDCIRITPIPATYGTASPAPSFVEEVIPAEFITVEKQRLVSPATVEEVIVPAKYKTVTKQILKKEAGFEEIKVPAEFQTIDIKTRKGLALLEGFEWSEYGIIQTVAASTDPINIESPEIYSNWATAGCPTGFKYDEESYACKRNLVVPAEYRTVTKRTIKNKGGFSEWREVLCPGKISNAIEQVQKALLKKGFDPGPIDNILGPKTRAALIQFQEDNNLPHGNLDLKTMAALGIKG